MSNENDPAVGQPKKFYRFRKPEALLDDFHELEQQYFVFTPTSDLNDPMEGFSDVFWRGDEILWSSLIRHYIFSFVGMVRASIVLDDQFDPSLIDVFARSNPLPGYCSVPMPEYAVAWPKVLARPGVKRLVASLARRSHPVRRNELTCYLRLLHPIVAQIALQSLSEQITSTSLPFASFAIEAEFTEDLLSNFTPLSEEEELRTDIFFAMQQAEARNQLVTLALTKSKDPAAKMLRFFTSFFPFEYVESLEKLVFPRRYVASFSSSPSNSSMWGSYAKSHSGACLIFNADVDEHGSYLPINAVVGSTADRTGTKPLRRDARFYLEKVVYEESHPEVDFFGSLGGLTTESVEQFWFSHEAKLSPLYVKHFGSDEDFRKSYWGNFKTSSLCKTPEWAYENEYRLLMTSMSSDISQIEHRKAFYSFESLAGVIFGMKTSVEDKIKIVDIIRSKCIDTKRREFQFYQMTFLRDSRTFAPAPIDISVLPINAP